MTCMTIEDIGCFRDNHLICINTKERAIERRLLCTAVYKTNSKTIEIDSLTPGGSYSVVTNVDFQGGV